MERRLSGASVLSYSESDLDMIEFDTESLRSRSHFFAPSGPLYHRYSTPLVVISHPSSPPPTGGSQPSPATFSLLSSQGGVAAGRPLGVPDRFGLQSLPQHEDRGQQGGDRRDRTRYMNNDSLAHDLSFLATMPELCDVTFLVGEGREAVCAVRAILAARSR